MSAQLGQEIGLGIAPDQLTSKIQAYHGCYKINAAEVALPRLLAISKGVGDQFPAGEGTNSASFFMMAKGRLKKFGIYIKEKTVTGDMQMQFRINGVDAGAPIIIPELDSVERVYLSPDNLDIELEELDDINFILSMVSGAGTLNMSWCSHIEYDSEVDGDFPANMINLYHHTPNSASARRNWALQGNWISVADDQPIFPCLYNGRYKAIATNVPTGFGTLREKLSVAQVFVGATPTNSIRTDWAIGEVGNKFDFESGADSFTDADSLGMVTGQFPSGGGIEPVNSFFIIEVDLP